MYGNNSGSSIRLSASKALVWTNCTASVDLEKQMPTELLDKSEMAHRGTLLHAYAAASLIGDDRALKDARISDDEKSAMDFYVGLIKTQYMPDPNDSQDSEVKIIIEEKIELDVDGVTFVAVPDFAYIDYDSVTIIDLKTGYTSVPADNLQNKIYAHVVARHVLSSGGRFRPKKAFLRTVMPFLKTINYATIDISSDYLVGLAQDFKDRKSTFLTGVHCRYCDACTICPALQDRIKKLHDLKYQQQILRDRRFYAEWWVYKKVIEKFYNQLESEIYALNDLGQCPDGLKVIDGYSRRQWAESVTPEKLAKDLKLDIETVAELKLISPAQLEKRIGQLPKGAENFIVKTKSRSIVVDNDSTVFD